VKRGVRRSLDSQRTPQQLVRIALRAWGSDRSWNAIAALHMRGSPETLALAQRLSRSSSWRRRALGLHIASQLRQRRQGAESGSVEYALEATQRLLLAHLHDPHDEVVGAAVSGLGHRPHPEALGELVRLASHPSSDLRWSVAVALGRYPEPLAIDALLHLARDGDDDVRDWATFGLGSMQDADTLEVRELLWMNLSDADPDVRGEAVIGLAARNDPRAVEYLLTHLDDECGMLDLNAAARFASQRLLRTGRPSMVGRAA